MTTTCSREGSENLPEGLVAESCDLGSAVFDAAREYRYRLTRCWGTARPRLCWIMLNPSTASATEDDNTIRRVLGFTRAWGYDSIEVVNLFAWRTPNQRDLKRVADPVGPHNDGFIAVAVSRSDAVVAAWGNGGTIANPMTGISRCDEVMRLLSGREAELQCLDVTKLHQPRHPLYVSQATTTTRMVV